MFEPERPSVIPMRVRLLNPDQEPLTDWQDALLSIEGHGELMSVVQWFGTIGPVRFFEYQWDSGGHVGDLMSDFWTTNGWFTLFPHHWDEEQVDAYVEARPSQWSLP